MPVGVECEIGAGRGRGRGEKADRGGGDTSEWGRGNATLDLWVFGWMEKP